ncbi:hypothetical protein H6503_04975 [Candidatus Woesearchaeota archaeon]|nr:hypothetical protein [Candidatus Woesearchaeota archaeon]
MEKETIYVVQTFYPGPGEQSWNDRAYATGNKKDIQKYYDKQFSDAVRVKKATLCHITAADGMTRQQIQTEKRDLERRIRAMDAALA